MKPLHLALATTLCLLASCSMLDGSDDDGPTPASTAPSSGTRVESAPGDAIPSQAEYDSKATKSITQQNADAEFEKLKKEIEGDG